jgi:hypothetical protein
MSPVLHPPFRSEKPGHREFKLDHIFEDGFNYSPGNVKNEHQIDSEGRGGALSSFSYQGVES